MVEYQVRWVKLPSEKKFQAILDEMVTKGCKFHSSIPKTLFFEL